MGGTLIEILYQDDHLVLVNKPAKLLVHPSFLDTHETVFLVNLLKEQLGRAVFPIHRLDRPTSGVLLCALDSHTAHKLAVQFETHAVTKTYWAVVRGFLQGDGQIDYPLKPRLDKIADKFANADKPAQAAITDYQGLAVAEMPFVACERFATSRYSLVQLCPKTGRKHQLRRHLKHIFHPIVGDTTYGDKKQNRAVLANVGVGRLLLHARSLTFDHPICNERLTITAPLDGEFGVVFRAFGWQNWV